MWWRAEPQTEAERQQEIAQLEAVRDRLLEDAPRSFAMSRFVMTTMSAMFLIAVANVAAFHPDKINLGFFVFVVVFGGIMGTMMRKLWVAPPAPGDRWGMSDRIGYEGDSPRDLQAKIDRLRER
jgi:hypothetical protein